MALLRSSSLLLSLLCLTSACSPDPGDSATDTDASTGADSSSGADSSGGATEPGPTDTSDTAATDTAATDTDTDPTGGPEFPLCQAPEPTEGIGFLMTSGTLPLGEDVDVMCQVDSGAVDGNSVTIELTCTDAMNATHPITIFLDLFYAPTLALLDGMPQVHLVHRDVDSFDQREVLSLRGPDDELLLFAAAGFEIFAVEDPALWAPVSFTPVAEALCETVGDCDTVTRTALDVTLAETTERVFDRDWAALGAGLSVHVGAAQIVDHYTDLEKCAPGDAPEGLNTTVIIIAEQ